MNRSMLIWVMNEQFRNLPMINDQRWPMKSNKTCEFLTKKFITSISGTVNLEIIGGGGNIIDKHRRIKFSWRLSIGFDGSIEINEYLNFSGELSLGDVNGLSNRFFTCKKCFVYSTYKKQISFRNFSQKKQFSTYTFNSI